MRIVILEPRLSLQSEAIQDYLSKSGYDVGRVASLQGKYYQDTVKRDTEIFVVIMLDRFHFRDDLANLLKKIKENNTDTVCILVSTDYENGSMLARKNNCMFWDRKHLEDLVHLIEVKKGNAI